LTGTRRSTALQLIGDGAENGAEIGSNQLKAAMAATAINAAINTYSVAVTPPSSSANREIVRPFHLPSVGGKATYQA
jgi:hypothetical protein